MKPKLSAAALLLTGVLAASGCDTNQPVLMPLAPAPTSPPPPVPPPNVNPASGPYDLTLTIESACAGLPEAEKIRKYSARLDDDGPARYVVTLAGPAFLSGFICTAAGLDCNQFRASEEGEDMRFLLENNSEWHGGYITEQTASGGWIVIYGEAVGPRTDAWMEAKGPGNVWHCPVPSASPFPTTCGGAGSRTPSVSCTSNLKLAFTKK